MITIDEMQTMLDQLAEELPEVFYKELNGGIILLPEAKFHEKSLQDDLFIMGEYYKGGNLGRYIVIYYGSFIRVYGNQSNEQMKEQLGHTLKHEFRHHLESLGGEKDLEVVDAITINKYLESK